MNKDEILFSDKNKINIINQFKLNLNIFNDTFKPLNEVNLDLYTDYISLFDQISEQYIDLYNKLNNN